MSKALKQLAGQTVIYGISSILSRILNYFFLAMYLTRIMEKSEYGIFTDMYVYVAFLITLMTYRMDTALFRFGRKKENLGITFSTATISLLISTIVISSIFYIFSSSVANFISYPGHENYIKILIGVLTFDVISSIAFAKLRLENRPLKFALLKTLSVLINIFSLVFFLEIIPYLINNGYTFFNEYYDSEKKLDYLFISNIIASFLVLIFLIPEFRKVKFKFDKKLWKRMMIYALPLVLVGLAAVFNQSGAIPMLKYLLPGEVNDNLDVVGVYSASAKIAILMNLFTYAFNYAAEPFFFSHAEKSDSKVIYAQVSQAFAFVASIIFLGILLYLDMFQYILGKDFREGLAVVPILLIANLFLGLYYNFSIWYKLTDKTIFGAGIAWGGSLITLLINLLFLEKYGYIASAWATLFCYGFMATAAYGFGQKYYPVAYPIKKISFYILGAIGIYYLSIYINISNSFSIKMIINTFFLSGYILFVFLLDRKDIMKLIKRN